MKLRAFVPILIASIFVLFQGCNNEKGIFELFSGTLPRLEIPDEEGSRYTTPQSLFFTMKGDAVELEGEVYPLQLSSEDEQHIRYSTTIPIQGELTLNGLTYLKTEESLLLHFSQLEKELRLEKFSTLMERKTNEFAEVELTSDLSHLSDNQRSMIGLLFQVADIMDEIYWAQVFPDRDAAMSSLVDENISRFFQINYGPWERLNGNLPYLPGYGPKPSGIWLLPC